MVAGIWSRSAPSEVIRANWDVLTRPETTYQEAGVVLGVTVPDGYDGFDRLGGGCP